MNCFKGKCIHGSTAKSAVGTMEAMFWKMKGTYKYIDSMICCSEFMKTKLDTIYSGTVYCASYKTTAGRMRGSTAMIEK